VVSLRRRTCEIAECFGGGWGVLFEVLRQRRGEVRSLVDEPARCSNLHTARADEQCFGTTGETVLPLNPAASETVLRMAGEARRLHLLVVHFFICRTGLGRDIQALEFGGPFRK